MRSRSQSVEKNLSKADKGRKLSNWNEKIPPVPPPKPSGYSMSDSSSLHHSASFSDVKTLKKNNDIVGYETQTSPKPNAKSEYNRSVSSGFSNVRTSSSLVGNAASGLFGGMGLNIKTSISNENLSVLDSESNISSSQSMMDISHSTLSTGSTPTASSTLTEGMKSFFGGLGIDAISVESDDENENENENENKDKKKDENEIELILENNMNMRLHRTNSTKLSYSSISLEPSSTFTWLFFDSGLMLFLILFLYSETTKYFILLFTLLNLSERFGKIYITRTVENYVNTWHGNDYPLFLSVSMPVFFLPTGCISTYKGLVSRIPALSVRNREISTSSSIDLNRGVDSNSKKVKLSKIARLKNLFYFPSSFSRVNNYPYPRKISPNVLKENYSMFSYLSNFDLPRSGRISLYRERRLSLVTRVIQGNKSRKLQRKASILIQSIVRGFQARKFYKKELERLKVAREILESEVSYSKQLELVVDAYMKPLRRECVSSNKRPRLQMYSEVFLNTETLLAVSRMLSVKLAQIIESWTIYSCVGSVFDKVTVDSMETYTEFVDNFDFAMGVLTENMKKDIRLREFLDSVQEEPRLKNRSLNTLLIAPVQRIPRYLLLMGELLKYTEHKHPDFQTLSQAKERMQELANLVNESKRDRDAAERVIQIQNLLQGVRKEDEGTLVTATRRFVHEGDVVELNSKGGESHRHLFLFNDSLLFTKKSTGSILSSHNAHSEMPYKFKNMISFEGLSAEPIYTTGILLRISSLIPTKQTKHSSGGSISLSTSSKAEQEKWIEVINDTIDKYKEKKKSMPKQRAPIPSARLISGGDRSINNTPSPRSATLKTKKSFNVMGYSPRKTPKK